MSLSKLFAAIAGLAVLTALPAFAEPQYAKPESNVEGHSSGERPPHKVLHWKESFRPIEHGTENRHKERESNERK